MQVVGAFRRSLDMETVKALQEGPYHVLGSALSPET